MVVRQDPAQRRRAIHSRDQPRRPPEIPGTGHNIEGGKRSARKDQLYAAKRYRRAAIERQRPALYHPPDPKNDWARLLCRPSRRTHLPKRGCRRLTGRAFKPSYGRLTGSLSQITVPDRYPHSSTAHKIVAAARQFK